ncbi:MAG: MarR family winged helix-turn-helix transcriptional regulator [Pseudobdellovibrionaceae bacterium]
MDSIRKIVKSLRQASKLTEKKIGLSAAQLFVLQKIAESDKPLSINELAKRTLTHQSSVSVVVAKLMKSKMVERLASKEDARAVEIRLSKKGRELVTENLPLIQERLVEGISRLSPVERNGLVKGLNALIEKAGLQGEEPSLFFEDEKGDKE